MTQKIRFPMAPINDVYVENGYQVQKNPLNPAESIVKFTDALGLAQAVRTAIIHKPGRLNCFEIAYLRKRMDLFQKELAELIGTSEQSFHLWESGKGRIPVTEDAALRTIFLEKERKQLSVNQRKLSFSKAVELAFPEDSQFEYLGKIEDGEWFIKLESKPVEYSVGDASHEGFVNIYPELIRHFGNESIDPVVVLELKLGDNAKVEAEYFSGESLYGGVYQAPGKIYHSLQNHKKEKFQKISLDWTDVLDGQQGIEKNVYKKAQSAH